MADEYFTNAADSGGRFYDLLILLEEGGWLYSTCQLHALEVLQYEKARILEEIDEEPIRVLLFRAPRGRAVCPVCHQIEAGAHNVLPRPIKRPSIPINKEL